MNFHTTRFDRTNRLVARYLMAATAFVLAVAFALPRPASAGTLGADKLALFPKETGEFGYADLKRHAP